MAGVIANAKAAGRRVYVAIVTNGDQGGVVSTDASYCGLAVGAGSDAAKLGMRRNGETIAAMQRLGLQWSTIESASDVFFLGYPDSKMVQVANATTPITTDGTELHKTYAKAGNGSTSDTCHGDLSYLLNGQPSDLDRVNLARDMDDLLDLAKPTDIYTHSTFEGHADHQEVARQVIAAVIRSHDSITVHGTLIHPEGTDSCSTQSSFVWPGPAGDQTTDPTLRFTPTVDFSAPPTPRCSASPTGTSWGPAGAPTFTPTVPSSMQDTDASTNLKWKTIQDYASQLSCQPPGPNWHFSCGYLRAFVKHDEIFWDQRFGVGMPLSYANTVNPEPNLDSYWRFGEPSGTTTDAAHGSHDGTYSSATLASAGLLTNDSDTAVGFTGSTSVSVGDFYEFAGTAHFSLEAWVKPTTVDGTARRVFSKEESGGNDGWYLINSTVDNLRFVRLHGGTYDTIVTSAPLESGATAHVVVTYDGADMRLYVNGALQKIADSSAALANTTTSFTIGAKSTGGGEWIGTIDEPAVYTEPLTPGTIMSHYLAGLNRGGGPDAVAPSKPAAPTATAQDEVAQVSLGTLNGDADLADYTLQRKRSAEPASAWSPVATAITTWPVSDTGLANGVSYDYRVIALDASENSSTPSDPVAVTATDTIAPAKPAKPAKPAATALDGAVRLDLAPRNDEGDLASYTLQRKLTSESAGAWVAVATGVSAWPVTDAGLANGSSYDYRVIALDGSGHQSTPSDPVSATPAAAAPPPIDLTPPTPAIDSLAPTLSATVARVHSRRHVRRAGLRVRVGCSEGCVIRARLVLSAALARRAGLARREIATRRISMGAAGTTSIVLKMISSARSRLSRSGRFSATLSVRAVDGAGNGATTSRPILLR